MADAPIPIPEGLNLCGSPSDAATFLDLMQQNFNLLVGSVLTPAGIIFQFPPVPGLSFAIPPISIPGYAAGSWDTATPAPPLGDGYVGGRMPFSYPGGQVAGKGGYAGVGDWQWKGADFEIPGLKAMEMRMWWYDAALTLLAQSVPAFANIPFVPLGSANMCDPVQAAAAIQQMWTQLFLTPVGCPSLTAYQDFTLWTGVYPQGFTQESQSGADTVYTTTVTPTSVKLAGTALDLSGSGFASALSVRGIYILAPVFGTCRTLRIKLTSVITIDAFGVGEEGVTTELDVTDTSFFGSTLFQDHVLASALGIGTTTLVHNVAVGLPLIPEDRLIMVRVTLDTGGLLFPRTITGSAEVKDITITLNP